MAAPVARAGGEAASPLERPSLRLRDPAHAPLLAVARCGGRTLLAAGAHGVVLRSVDDGRHWQQSATPTSHSLGALTCVGAGVGWAVGHGGVVLGTRDAGVSWRRQLDGRAAAELVRQAAPAGPPRAEAERWVAEGADKPLLDVLAWSERDAIVIGAYGLALRTRDGGASWASLVDCLPNPKRLHLYAAARAGTRIVIAGEQGLLLRSDDDGEHFERVALPYEGSLFAAVLLDARTWLVAGLRGNAWASVDGGASWTPLRPPSAAPAAAFVAAAAAGAGQALLLDQAGQRYRWPAPAPTLLRESASAADPANGFAIAGDGALISVGDRGVVRASR
ncbi:MAG: hypothetical protein LCI02_03380 [Proteobacteria bacterium]|nr:hypothetical protein [Pseudomonadota bacterium]